MICAMLTSPGAHGEPTSHAACGHVMRRKLCDVHMHANGFAVVQTQAVASKRPGCLSPRCTLPRLLLPLLPRLLARERGRRACRGGRGAGGPRFNAGLLVGAAVALQPVHHLRAGGAQTRRGRGKGKGKRRRWAVARVVVVMFLQGLGLGLGG